MAGIIGITHEQSQNLINGKFPESLGSGEKVAWEVANALGQPGPLSQEIWDMGIQAIGKDGMVSLIHVIGFYQYVSVLLNGFDVKVPKLC